MVTQKLECTRHDDRPSQSCAKDPVVVDSARKQAELDAQHSLSCAHRLGISDPILLTQPLYGTGGRYGDANSGRSNNNLHNDSLLSVRSISWLALIMIVPDSCSASRQAGKAASHFLRPSQSCARKQAETVGRHLLSSAQRLGISEPVLLLFVRLCVRSACSFVRLFVRSFVRLVGSFVRSFVRLFGVGESASVRRVVVRYVGGVGSGWKETALTRLPPRGRWMLIPLLVPVVGMVMRTVVGLITLCTLIAIFLSAQFLVQH